MVQSKQRVEMNEANILSRRSHDTLVVAALKRLMDAALTAGLPRSSPAYEAAAIIANAASAKEGDVTSTQVLEDLHWIEDIVEGYDHVGTGSGKGADKAYQKTISAWHRLRGLLTGNTNVDHQGTRIADAMEACDWSGCSIGNKAILKSAVLHLRTNVTTATADDAPVIDVDELAQEIRRVDGSHSMGAGALAEALMPFLERAHKRNSSPAFN